MRFLYPLRLMRLSRVNYILLNSIHQSPTAKFSKAASYSKCCRLEIKVSTTSDESSNGSSKPSGSEENFTVYRNQCLGVTSVQGQNLYQIPEKLSCSKRHCSVPFTCSITVMNSSGDRSANSLRVENSLLNTSTNATDLSKYSSYWEQRSKESMGVLNEKSSSRSPIGGAPRYPRVTPASGTRHTCIGCVARFVDNFINHL